MNYVWNIDGVRVMSVTMNRWEGQQMWTSGYVQSGKHGIVQWEACATPNGYTICLTKANGFALTLSQTATYNLPLEVASAMQRL
jgi:hypothetical protein